MEQSQSVQQVGATDGIWFGITGGFTGTVSGCAISTTGGQSYTVYPAPFITQARYGAYPTPQTWFLAGGQWPNNTNIIENGEVHVSQKLKMKTSHKGKIQRIKGSKGTVAGGPGPNDYYTEILRTTNGGQSFSTVYTSMDYYPNDIRCVDDQTCFFVAESDSAVVMGTKDGGNTWQTLYSDDAGSSLITAWATSPTDWWAGGGNQNTGNGHILHSTDAGATWTVSRVPETYFMTISLVNSTYGFGAGATPLGSCQLYRYQA